MKKELLLFVLTLTSITFFSQEKMGKPFFTGSASITLERNEFDEGFVDDEPFFAPAAFLGCHITGLMKKERFLVCVTGNLPLMLSKVVKPLK